jgi:hypothetical protein
VLQWTYRDPTLDVTVVDDSASVPR